LLKVELRAPILRDQVHVFAVALDIAPDEGAEGEDRQPALASVAEGEGDKLAAQPLALEAIVDLGVGEGNLARLQPVLDEAGQLPVDVDLIALPLRAVGNRLADGKKLPVDAPSMPAPGGSIPLSRVDAQRQDLAGATGGEKMDTRADRSSGLGISLGGIVVIVGIVLMFVVSFWLGVVVTLVGLIAFGGFARGKWY
jgi:hypothetical protein